MLTLKEVTDLPNEDERNYHTLVWLVEYLRRTEGSPDMDVIEDALEEVGVEV